MSVAQYLCVNRRSNYRLYVYFPSTQFFFLLCSFFSVFASSDCSEFILCQMVPLVTDKTQFWCLWRWRSPVKFMSSKNALKLNHITKTVYYVLSDKHSTELKPFKATLIRMISVSGLRCSRTSICVSCRRNAIDLPLRKLIKNERFKFHWVGVIFGHCSERLSEYNLIECISKCFQKLKIEYILHLIADARLFWVVST